MLCPADRPRWTVGCLCGFWACSRRFTRPSQAAAQQKVFRVVRRSVPVGAAAVRRYSLFAFCGFIISLFAAEVNHFFMFFSVFSAVSRFLLKRTITCVFYGCYFASYLTTAYSRGRRLHLIYGLAARPWGASACLGLLLSAVASAVCWGFCCLLGASAVRWGFCCPPWGLPPARGRFLL